jgi:hypothetical protein
MPASPPARLFTSLLSQDLASPPLLLGTPRLQPRVSWPTKEWGFSPWGMLSTKLALLFIAAPLAAQQSMGTVATHDALVTGGLEVRNDRATLLTNAAITAYDHTAAIDLARGGDVLVCATSQFHLLHSGTGPSLAFALDRGAVELRGFAQPQDVILTPDLRFTLAPEGPEAQAGQFDLRLRVTPNGDTCVDNAGTTAPTLSIADVFSDATYRLLPGQHVLFEHGSLHEVVDRETSSCGCPATTPPPILAADATPAERTAAQNPFPAAISQGLAPPKPIDNSAPIGETHTQVSSIIAYGGNQPDSIVAALSPSPIVLTHPPPSPPGIHSITHAIGHFFRKLFHPAS